MEISPLFIICVLTMLKNFMMTDLTNVLHNFSGSHISIGIENYHRELISSKMDIYEVFITFTVFLITDAVRYKLVIIIGSVMVVGMSFVIFFHWTSDIILVLCRIALAFVYSVSIAKSAYLYAKIQDKSKYQKITAYVQASGIIGLCLSLIWMQIYANTLLKHLTAIPIFVSITLATTTFIFLYLLPPVDCETPSNDVNTIEMEQGISPTLNTSPRIQCYNIQSGLSQIWPNFKTAYTDINVLKWSIWFILTAFLITEIEIDDIELPLFSEKESFVVLKSPSMIWHFTSLLISAALIILCSIKLTKWETRGDWILSLVSFVLGVLTTIQCFYPPELIRTIISQVFIMIVDVFLTISVWEIVAIVPKNSYALITGFNVFMIHVLKHIKRKILDDRREMPIYALVFLAMGIVFGILEKRRPKNAGNVTFLNN